MKQFKTLLALVLAMMMVLSVASVALASETPTTPSYTTSVTVNNLAPGDVVKLYKIAGASIDASNSIVYDWQGSLTEDDFDWDDEGTTFVQNSDGQKAALAAYNALKSGNPAYTSDAVATGATSVTISDVAPGYYVAFVEGTENSGAVYQRMIINTVPVANTTGDGTYVAHDAITINAKKEPITITKTEDLSATDASQVTTTDNYHIGDYINFTLTSSIPSYPEDSTYAHFIITDTPNGLDDDEESVEVFINGSSTKTAAGTDTFTVAGTSKGFTVTFAKTFILAHPAESVVVKYRAKLEGPVNLDGETSNTATITYNPNPSEDTDVTPPGPTDEQNIYGVVVFKYEDGTTTALQGAEFELWEGTIDPNDSTKVIKGTTKVKGPTATDENGLLAWDGLKDGVYALIETKAPANYRLDSNPRLVILNENQTLGDNPLTSDTETYFLRSEVPNTPGTTLPSTGGIGTTIFYIAGIVLVLGAAAIIIARRKAEQQ